MKFIKAVDITDAILTASSISEPDTGEVAWNAVTNYTVDQLAYRASTHRIYKCKVDGASATPPESDPTKWKDYLPTNKWAMFDREINTQSQATGTLSVTLAPGMVNTLILMELEGAQVHVTMESSPGGSTVVDETVSLDISVVTDLYEYFFEPFATRGTLILRELPPYLNCRITITITGTGTVKCGQCLVGTEYHIGDTEADVTAGIRSFTKVEEDEETQVIRLKKGKRMRKLRARLQVPIGAENAIHKLLEEAEGAANVWIADDTGESEPLVVYGFTDDFEFLAKGRGCNFYTISIRGMT